MCCLHGKDLSPYVETGYAGSERRPKAENGVGDSHPHDYVTPAARIVCTGRPTGLHREAGHHTEYSGDLEVV